MTTTKRAAELDWANLGFVYVKTPWRFQAEHRGGVWTQGELLEDAQLHIEEGATSLHYAQQCFEGLKAFRHPDGKAYIFRPSDNFARMASSSARLLMPTPPEPLFLRACLETVKANLEFVPPADSGASLYIRPLLIGVGDNLGLRAATRYIFRTFCSPVGPYFKGGLKAVKLRVTAIDRVAKSGTGAYKVGGNYAGGLMATQEAKQAGYDEALYLDPIEHRYLEEAGSANVFGILPPRTPGGPARLVTPESPSILPSITLKSVLTLAKEELGLEVERRRVSIDEVPSFAEMGCTGTAAVITPVGTVHHAGKDTVITDGVGPITRKLYDLLTGIQRGKLADKRGWCVPVE